MRKITGNIDFTPKWWRDTHQIEAMNPMLQSMEEQLAMNARKSRILARQYGHLGIGHNDPDPVYQVPQYDGRVLTASAFGGEKPGWDPLTACYWWDKRNSVWGSIDDPREIARIKVPAWENNPLVNETLDRYEKEKDRPCYQTGKVSFPWTMAEFHDPRDQTDYDLLEYMSAVDLAPFLYGDTNFFSILISDETLAFAITEKCYEIATSYAEFMQKHLGLDGRPNGWGNIGGDYSTILSPSLYEKYCKPQDHKRTEYCKKAGRDAINLHSCGKSDHLYKTWSDYPEKANIKIMQTRGIPGQLSRLRECLPDTWIQWTLHQPQCDFENISRDEVRKLITQYAAEAGYENLEFTAIVAQTGENTDRNIEAFYNTIETINQNLECGLLP